MKINYNFDVTARVRPIDEEGRVNKKSESDMDLTLNIDSNIAGLFLFKFTPFNFKIGDRYIVIIKMNEYNSKIAFMMIIDKESEQKYIVMNLEQLLSEIIHGYNLFTIFNGIQVLSEYGLPSDDELEEEEND